MCCWDHLHSIQKYTLLDIPEKEPLTAFKCLRVRYLGARLSSPYFSKVWGKTITAAAPRTSTGSGIYSYLTETVAKARVDPFSESMVELEIWGRVIEYPDSTSLYKRRVPAGFRSQHAEIVNIWLPTRVWDRHPELPYDLKKRYKCEVHEL